MDDTRPPPTGDWLLTHTGKKFYPLDPRPESIDLEDIAHALAHLCRWTGHTVYHYSVAQHAVQVALAVQQMAPDYALLALHHDDAEAYLGDIARPWKRNLLVDVPAGPPRPIESVEWDVRQVILQALGIPDQPDAWPIIAAADNRVLQAESEQLMPGHAEFPRFGRPPLCCSIPMMKPHQAKDAFLALHACLTQLQ